jgi:hypothetical protein
MIAFKEDVDSSWRLVGLRLIEVAEALHERLIVRYS